MSVEDIGRWVRDRNLTSLLLFMFAVFALAQAATGFAEYNAEHTNHGQPLQAYLGTGHPWKALSENWESEFLQMAVFVFLTTFLIQKGSPESRRPGVREFVDTDPRDFTNDPTRRGRCGVAAGSCASMNIRLAWRSCCSS